MVETYSLNAPRWELNEFRTKAQHRKKLSGKKFKLNHDCI